MKILELFSGTECLSNAFRARGHECFTVDWDRRFPSSLHTDIMQLTAERILTDFGRPDIIWALRSAYPPKLCEHIVSICERYFDREPLPVRWHIDAKPPVQLELF